MLNSLPHDKNEILLNAHNSDYDCRFILDNIQNVNPIVKSNRFLHVKATYYNTIAKKKIDIIVKDNYKFITKSLTDFGKYFELDCQKK